MRREGLRDHRVRGGALERQSNRVGGSALWWGEAATAGSGVLGAVPGGFSPSIEPKFGLQGRRGLPPGVVRWDLWGICQSCCSIWPWLRGASPVSFTIHP